MSTLLTLIHIFVCFILIVAVLLQSGKSADLAGAFGGGGSQSVFGPRGAGSFLSKVTTACAVLFMITSFGLWLLSAKESKSVVRGEEAPVTEAATPIETKKEDEGVKSPETKQEQQTETKEQKGTEKEKK